MATPVCFCKYCDGPVYARERMHKNQMSHTTCVKERGPDIRCQVGNFKLELYSELLTAKKLKKIIRSIPVLKSDM